MVRLRVSKNFIQITEVQIFFFCYCVVPIVSLEILTTVKIIVPKKENQQSKNCLPEEVNAPRKLGNFHD